MRNAQTGKAGMERQDGGKPLWSSHGEKLISGLGGFVGIACVFGFTRLFEQRLDLHLLLVASFGASAVLLFAAPHAPLSQPWNVVGGHMVSALIGVSVFAVITDPVFGSAIAVGSAITAMYYLKCLHPPGGATAAIPFLTGAGINSYGYEYVFMPVGVGAVLIVLIALLFNYPFAYRRYPISLARGLSDAEPVEHDPAYASISHAELVYAISEIDSFVDASEQDLLRIYEIATGRKHPQLDASSSESQDSNPVK